MAFMSRWNKDYLGVRERICAFGAKVSRDFVVDRTTQNHLLLQFVYMKESFNIGVIKSGKRAWQHQYFKNLVNYLQYNEISYKFHQFKFHFQFKYLRNDELFMFYYFIILFLLKRKKYVKYYLSSYIIFHKKSNRLLFYYTIYYKRDFEVHNVN